MLRPGVDAPIPVRMAEIPGLVRVDRESTARAPCIADVDDAGVLLPEAAGGGGP
jgi:hypothetical protein